MPNEPKPDHKATISIESLDQESIDRAIEAMQEFIIKEGLAVAGKIKYEMPLDYRRRGQAALAVISSGRPMDKYWQDEDEEDEGERVIVAPSRRR